MRKALAVIGILLTVIVLISGSVVAVWHYAVSIYDYEDVINPSYILGQPDPYFASLGDCGRLGWILLDLGSGNEMGPSQNFTVFANSPVYEENYVYVGETPNIGATMWVGQGNDMVNETFQTPSTPFKSWRYIFIQAITGVWVPDDPIYGPEIDAVGWYSP